MSVPRFTRLRVCPDYLRRGKKVESMRIPKAETNMGRVYSLLKEEGGVWTAGGIAEIMQCESRKASKVLNELEARGLVKRAGTLPNRPRVFVYEAAV